MMKDGHVNNPGADVFVQEFDQESNYLGLGSKSNFNRHTQAMLSFPQSNLYSSPS